MLQRKTVEDPGMIPNLRETVGIYVKAGVGLTIYSGLLATLHEADDLTQAEVIAMYREISGDNRLTIGMHSARQVIKGDLQAAWYVAMGKDVPHRVTSNQEERMAKAKQATAESEQEQTAAKSNGERKPRTTIRSIIETGLLAGTPHDQILKQVHEFKPGAKADEKHIAYYRHYLIAQGKMERPAKVEKPKKEKTSETALKSAADGKVEKGDVAEKPTAKQGPAARRALADKASSKGK
jgi:hypothetical protein